MLDVSVLMVTWNSESHLAAALRSLGGSAEGLRWELVVADNDSSDGSVELVRALVPDARIVQTGANLGYAAGLNAALAAASPAKAFLCLNADVQLAEGAVTSMLRCAQKTGAGLVVPRLVDENGRLSFSIRRDPSVSRAWGEAILGGIRSGRHHRLGEMVVRSDDYGRESVIDWATGAVMLVTRECQSAVGRWDESFFLYSEETDFALRARDAGFTARYCPDASAVHQGGDRHVSEDLYALLTLNRVRLYARRHRAGPTAMFAAAVTVNELLRSHRRVNRAALRALAVPSVRRVLMEVRA